MTLTRCLAKLCPLMNELKQAYLPNKHNKPAKFFLTFADGEWIGLMRYDSIYSWRDRCPEVHVRAAVAICGIARGCSTPNSLTIDWMTVAGSLEEPQ